MTHPITPPPELVQQWFEEASELDIPSRRCHIATRAAAWGSDQELEACCEWLEKEEKEREHLGWAYRLNPQMIRAARRPKPPSVKEQALDLLHLSFDRGYLKEEAADTIRRALEALPE